MIVNQGISAAYRPNPAEQVAFGNDTPINELEFKSFDSLLSDSDKRTLAAMDDYAVQNGIPAKEMSDIKSIIGGMKAMAPKLGKPNPEIDRDLMSTLIEDANAGRSPLNSSYLQTMLTNFDQLQGISIKA